MGSEMLNAIGLSAKNLDCGMIKHQQSPSSTHGDFTDASECCQNQFELFHSETEQNLKVISLDAPQLIFISAFTQVFILGQSPILDTDSTSPLTFPPLIKQDYTVLYQSFLI